MKTGSKIKLMSIIRDNKQYVCTIERLLQIDSSLSQDIWVEFPMKDCEYDMRFKCHEVDVMITIHLPAA